MAATYDLIAFLTSGGLTSGGFASGQVGVPHMASGLTQGLLSQNGTAIGSRSLLDQTAANSGSIVSAPATGLYRIESYAEITQGGLLNAGILSTTLNWTSDVQGQTLTPIASVALATSGAFGQAQSVVRALSGTPFIFTVNVGSLVGLPHYNAFAAVERLF